MKKGWIILLGVVAFIVIVVMMLMSSYNGFVAKDEAVTSQWGNVETVYQRRADLIPNLVETVKGYAAHEQETLQGVVEARAKATQMQAQLTPETLNDPAMMQKFQAAQGQLSSALGRLMVIVEQYPDLKANQNFLDLQAQLEGTENRIAVERRRYNEMAQAYNTAIRRFPGAMIASLTGFEKHAYFEAAEGSEQAPAVKF
ncbi:MAG: LemA family protein [Calditrichaeota bacterium]|nr:LemA family protein [Candidatus Cloacimonadota bacterium]MCB1046885.1 LemA family protein [Calditrichota bacterium]MCB9472709.1 LemA family protein [Candidatus Delongbacteria bacterium]